MKAKVWKRSGVVAALGFAVALATGQGPAGAQTDQPQPTSPEQPQHQHKHNHAKKPQTSSDGQDTASPAQPDAAKQ